MLCALLLPASPSARAQESTPSAPAEGPRRTALVVFVSYRGYLPAFPDPIRVRHTASSLLAAALEDPGHEVVAYPELEVPMQRWRVRSERDLALGFLDALASEFSADELVVGTLSVAADRVVFLTRASSLDSRLLFRVGLVEELTRTERWVDETSAFADLEEILTEAAGRLAKDWAVRGPRAEVRTLVMLPLRPVGVERGLSDIALHCLLRSLLRSGKWAVPDPAVTVFVLQQKGFDPLFLDAGSRHMLASQFATDTLLVPRLSSFPLHAQTRADIEEDASERLGVPLEENRGVPLHFSLVAVDCASGRLVSGAGTYLAPVNPTGILGIEKKILVSSRLQEGADYLVRSLFKGD